jgi:hypothetical protein
MTLSFVVQEAAWSGGASASAAVFIKARSTGVELRGADDTVRHRRASTRVTRPLNGQ